MVRSVSEIIMIFWKISDKKLVLDKALVIFCMLNLSFNTSNAQKNLEFFLETILVTEFMDLADQRVTAISWICDQASLIICFQ